MIVSWITVTCYSSHKNLWRVVDKFLLFTTHYVKKLLLLQFQTGSICRSFASCWRFLLLALADVRAPSAQLVPSQIHIRTASMWFPRDDTGPKLTKCAVVTTTRASVLNIHLLPTHLSRPAENLKNPEAWSRDSQAAFLCFLPPYPHPTPKASPWPRLTLH